MKIVIQSDELKRGECKITLPYYLECKNIRKEEDVSSFIYSGVYSNKILLKITRDEVKGIIVIEIDDEIIVSQC